MIGRPVSFLLTISHSDALNTKAHCPHHNGFAGSFYSQVRRYRVTGTADGELISCLNHPTHQDVGHFDIPAPTWGCSVDALWMTSPLRYAVLNPTLYEAPPADHAPIQGLSYTLSTLTVPTLLTLPSASTAAKAFRSLTTTATTHLRTLAGISSTAFFLAFALSPRSARHPYLLYTSVLVAISRLSVSDFVAPYLFAHPHTPAQRQSPSATARKDRSATRRMEASYDVIGGSDAHSDSASDRSIEDDPAAADNNVNGEEVRGEVEVFLKKQVVSTATAGLGFLMAVVGIWGDGVAVGYVSETVVNVVEF